MNATALGQALERAGVVKKSALARVHKIAEECWREAAYKPTRPQGGGPKAHDPIKAMRLFESRTRGDADLILEIIGDRYWHNLIRTFLELNQADGRAWKYSDTFRRSMKQLESKQESARNQGYAARRSKIDSAWALQVKEASKVSARESYRRKVAGIKRVAADVDVNTGGLIRLIDKEYGPFAHIRINGLELPKVTTEQALRYCDNQTNDVRFVRALCGLIPDPRKPIGEQWTANMIREAKRIAGAE